MVKLKKDNVILRESDPGKIKELELQGFEQVEEKKAPTEEKPLNKLTKDEIKAQLEDLEVDFDASANKDALVEQLQEALSE